ncbi:nuclease domain-containing protein [Shewanella vesiculosa]|uniref:nuclease domain-containing protein n=1 Tax=Shewanella vesiculosa TaxID=518738 RepID=UPI003851092D
MKPKFEVKYLDVKWYDKNTVLSVEESFVNLELEFDEKLKHFDCFTVIYPKAEGISHGQLAFRLLSDSKSIPSFEIADGQRLELKKIYDKDTSKTWWVEGDIWLKESQRWAGKSHRTAGNIKAFLAGQICKVIISSSDFTSEQLNLYLSDFKSDLWELILDESSYVTGKAKRIQEGGVSEESIQLITNLLSHAQNILKTPKSELREIQTLKPRKMVKPVKRTFMELATKGDGKFLTSRATEPSYNVPENRYVLFALLRIYKILKQLVTISGSKSNRFLSNVTKLNERLSAFSDVRKIDKNLVKRDLEKLRFFCSLDYINVQLEKKFAPILCCSNATQAIRYLKIGGATRNGDSIFVGVKDQLTDSWIEGIPGGQSIFMKYANEEYNQLFEAGLEYLVSSDLAFSDGYTNQGTYWRTYYLSNVSNIKVVGGIELFRRRQKFNDQRNKALELNKLHWITKLNNAELAEQGREKLSVQTQLAFYQTNQIKVQRVYEQLSPKLVKFKSLIDQLLKMRVKPSSTFPNSMTFVQNPDYQAVHSGYKKLREMTNITDEDLLLSLEKVEEIGLINMPLLYERWCLLQIIKVLVQNYHYQPTDDWKRKLLKIISTRQHSESLCFSNEALKRDIKLRYEPVLDNGRTPDFVIDVSFECKDGNRSSKRFVMDAKFYSVGILKSHGGISGVIKHLYQEKNYSEDETNAVFMLHPAQNAIIEKVSPQTWGEYSYLGELAMFDWDELTRIRYHQYGAICANPVLRLRYLDEFQRMIGMFLQYGIEDNNLNGLPDDVESMNFCIACGSHELTKIETHTGNQKSSWYECNICKHFTVYNHCYSCDTRLVKNGEYWSYHSQMPLQPLNIKCPACESLL